MLPFIFAAAFIGLVLERCRPGWKLPAVRTWPMRLLVINAVQLGVVLLAGVSWERWLGSRSLFHLSAHLGPWSIGCLAYFIATFIFYWWHRWRHEVNFLWRGFHQIHHSPQRIEVLTSFYKHPIEIIFNSILGSLLVYTLLGASLEGGAIYTFFTAAGEFFYHTNVRTPRWIGFVFQRPEMHRIHHEFGKHRDNYGDIVWWDMLFGTYQNPKTWDASCGFEDAREQSFGRMLRFEDVHASARPEPQVHVVASSEEDNHAETGASHLHES